MSFILHFIYLYYYVFIYRKNDSWIAKENRVKLVDDEHFDKRL